MIWKLGLGALLLAVLILNLGGSMIWHLLGFGLDLEIEGTAPQLEPITAPAWGSYGGDPGGQRFAPVRDITRDNVDRLETAWTFNTGALARHPKAAHRANFQATPILAADQLVLCTPFNEVIALDPGTGTVRWRFDPEVPVDGRPGNGYTCRGVAFWTAPDAAADRQCSARILAATVDARVLALDARTGAPCSDFGRGGQVQIEASLPLDWPGEYQVTSAPAIINDLVIVGSSISDNSRVLAPAGTVHALDVRTGAIRWQFDPVPRDPDDPAHDSWDTDALPGHANVWAPISVDPERNLVLLPTSSASPDFYGGLRPGDNRYTSSVVALHADSGTVAWDFQTVHHDVWDYDVPAQPGLYDVLQADGGRRPVVAQITKTGLLFVLDRDSGEPVLPVEERPVPQGGAPGEALAPTQPFPLTPPLVPSNVGPAFGITLYDRLWCQRRFDGAQHDGLYTPPTRQGTLLHPFNGGGGNWGSTAFDPSRNLLVVNLSNLVHLITLNNKDADGATGPVEHEAEYAPMRGAPYGMTREVLRSPFGLPCNQPPWGVLAAVDLASGRIVWRTRFGSVARFAAGVDLRLGMPGLGGPLITESGLVFIGAAFDDMLHAFDVATGALLWRAPLPAGGQATPMGYRWAGRDYIVIAAGGHRDTGLPLGDSLVAFSLPDGG